MNGEARIRLSLILPLATPRGVVAASQLVLFVLARARVELDLARGPSATMQAQVPGRPGAVLYIAANLGWSNEDVTRTNQFERGLRARISQSYARQGITICNCCEVGSVALQGTEVVE